MDTAMVNRIKLEAPGLCFLVVTMKIINEEVVSVISKIVILDMLPWLQAYNRYHANAKGEDYSGALNISNKAEFIILCCV